MKLVKLKKQEMLIFAHLAELRFVAMASGRDERIRGPGRAKPELRVTGLLLF